LLSAKLALAGNFVRQMLCDDVGRRLGSCGKSSTSIVAAIVNRRQSRTPVGPVSNRTCPIGNRTYVAPAPKGNLFNLELLICVLIHALGCILILIHGIVFVHVHVRVDHLFRGCGCQRIFLRCFTVLVCG